MQWLSFFQKKSPRRVTLGIALLKGMKAIVGVLSVMVMARYFGISLARDQWVVALTILTGLIQFAFGPMNETFRSKLALIRSKSDSQEHFRETAASTIKWMFLFSLIVSLFCIPFVDQLISAFGYVRSGSAFEALRLLLLISLPTLVLSEITTLISGVLNLYGVFFIPELCGVLGVLVNTVIVALFANSLGVYSLWLGYLLNLLILSVVLALQFGITRIGFRRVLFAGFRGFKECFVFSSAMYLPLIFAQLSVLTERVIAARIGVGNVAGLDYARKILDVPMGVVTTSIATVLGPILADQFGKKNLTSLYEETARVARMMILGVTPPLLVFFVAPEVFIRLLLKRGLFDEQAVALTAGLLRLYTPGVLGAILLIAIGQAMMASGRLSRLVLATIIIQGGIIAGNIFLSPYLRVYAFPLSWSAMHLLVGGVLLLGIASESKQTGLGLVEAVVLALGLGALFSSLRFVMNTNSSSFLLLVIGAGSLAVLISVRCLGFKEENAILQKVTQKLFQRWKSDAS
ncbi:MAG: hypothetical protein A2428_16480 [Bdellovibrionales bacterium RIFOXYC1_FULL_54_43]|nr:MAG: hypothetical protein A2428_16480 [Bdellovibrionales bacterium RIFOXYC1_FULL_54_43]